MRLTEEEKNRRIEKISILCDRTEDFDPILSAQVANPFKDADSPKNFDPSSNLFRSFSKQVLADVQDIVEAGQNKGVNDWGDRCREVRKKRKLSQIEVANFFDVDRSTIQEQENKVIEKTNGKEPIVVDWFYLAAYSLYFRISPYELLGLKTPHVACPMSTLEDSNTKYTNVIVASLFVENDQEKLSQLDNILTIAKMSKNAYEKFIRILKGQNDLKALREAFNRDPLQDPSAEKNEWGTHRAPAYIAAYENDDLDLGRIYLEATIAMKDLIYNRPDRLKVLAQLALGGELVANLIRDILAADPIHPKSLTWYYWGGKPITPKGTEFDPNKYGDEVRRIEYTDLP